MSLFDSIQGMGNSLLENLRGNKLAGEVGSAGGDTPFESVKNVRKQHLVEEIGKLRDSALIDQLRSNDHLGRFLNSNSLERPESVGAYVEFDRFRTAGGSTPSFPEMLEDLVRSVDAKSKAAGVEKEKLMLGKTDNIHQGIIAMQEASVAFSLLVEVRNKLIEAYQELSRMQV